MSEENDQSIYEVNLDDGGDTAVAVAPPPVKKAKKVKAELAPTKAGGATPVLESEEPLLEQAEEAVAEEVAEPVETEAEAEVATEAPVKAEESAEEEAVAEPVKAAETESEAEIAPIEPMEEPKAVTRLSRFKKADKLDEAELEKTLEYTELAHNRARTIQEGWAKDPVFRLATLEHWQRQGSLDPQYVPELEALRVKVGPQKETPKPAVAPAAEDFKLDPAVVKQALALRAANKDDEADALIATAAADLGERRALAKMRAELEPLKASDAERRKEASSAVERAEQAKAYESAAIKVRAECAQLAKTYPLLVGYNEATGKVSFKCKKFAEGFAANNHPDKSLLWIAKHTLIEQGRFGKPKTPPAAPKTAPTPVHGAGAGKRKPAASPDELVINVQ